MWPSLQEVVLYYKAAHDNLPLGSSGCTWISSRLEQHTHVDVARLVRFASRVVLPGASSPVSLRFESVANNKTGTHPLLIVVILRDFLEIEFLLKRHVDDGLLDVQWGSLIE